MGADTADVFVHDLLKTLKAIKRQDIARRNSSGNNLIATNLVILEGLENCLLQILVLFLTDLKLLILHVVDVIDRRLCGNPTFSVGSRRELVRGATDGVAGAEKSLDSHHPVVPPLVIGRSIVRRSARPGA